MGAAAARAHKHDHHQDEGVHFDGMAELDQDGIDALARTMVENEAKTAADGGATGDKDAQPTPEHAPKQPAIDATAGKSITIGGGVWTVMKGDSLWSIANEVYGKGTYWCELKKANKGKVHGKQNIIRDGAVLNLPELQVPTLTALGNFEDQPELFRDHLKDMSDEEYQGFLKNTPAVMLEKHAALVQDMELVRSTGMTMDELAEEQKQFLEAEAKRAGKSPGEFVRDLIKTEGYGGGTAKHWAKNTPKQKKKWHDRFKAAVKTIKATAPPDVKQIIKDAEAKRGGFRWDPEETEKNGAFAYTSGDWALHCGTQWVEAAEKDSAAVYGNIAHEMGGHNYYGGDNGSDIQWYALEKFSQEDNETAYSGGNSMFSAYGYMEHEIFAELYEFTYATVGNPTDTAFEVDAKGNNLSKEKRPGDVKHQLKRIRAAFAPKVAEGVVRGLWRRVQIDPRILDKAKELFARDVDAVFNLKLV